MIYILFIIIFFNLLLILLLLIFRYEFICVPLVHPLFKREFVSGNAKNRNGPFTRPDIVLCSSGKHVKK